MVPATLKGKTNYEVSVALHIRELWGNGAEPEDFVIEIEQLAATASVPVEPGDYTLEYTYDGKHIRKPTAVTRSGYNLPACS